MLNPEFEQRVREAVFDTALRILRPIVPFLVRQSMVWRLWRFFFRGAAAASWLKRYGPEADIEPMSMAPCRFAVILDLRKGGVSPSFRSPAPDLVFTIADEGDAQRLRERIPVGHFDGASRFLYVAGHCRPHPLASACHLRLGREHPDVELWYSDEVRRPEAGGTKSEVFCKPAWDPILFRGCPYVGDVFSLRGDAMLRVLDRPGRLPYGRDLFAAAVADRVQYVGHIPIPLFDADGPPRPADNNRNPAAPSFSSVKRPKASLIIPFRDRPELLRSCLDSVVKNTDYPDWECVLVDNGSREAATAAYLETVRGERIRVLRHDGEFNFSSLVNRGAEAAAGEILVLLNNDTEAVNPEWLSALADRTLIPGVGCVGSKLLFPNGVVQYGGILCGVGRQLDGAATPGLAHMGWPGASPGYFGLLSHDRTVSAVSGAALAVGRSVYASLGGFDPALAVSMNDVDFCLRVEREGYRNVWTPHSVLLHYGSASRKLDLTDPKKMARLKKEWEFMRKRWGARLENDAWHNPNLRPDGTCALRSPPAARVPRILPARTGREDRRRDGIY